jgi:hypothetical protein
MSVDAQKRVDPVRQQRTDDAMHVVEPMQNPKVGPRVIPIVVTLVIGLIIIALLFVAPWG